MGEGETKGYITPPSYKAGGGGGLRRIFKELYFPLPV